MLVSLVSVTAVYCNIEHTSSVCEASPSSLYDGSHLHEKHLIIKFTSSSFTVCMPFAPTLMPHRRDYDLCIYWRRMHGCTRLMIFFFFCLPEHICHLFVHRQCVFRACETSGNMSHVASRVYSVCVSTYLTRIHRGRFLKIVATLPFLSLPTAVFGQ